MESHTWMLLAAFVVFLLYSLDVIIMLYFKISIWCMMCMVLPLSSCVHAAEISPTDLTIVVCDANNQVLDSYLVPKDGKSRSVKFTLPDGVEEIRVIAIGERQHKDMPVGFYITGRPQNKKWMGLGYVEAHIQKGMLVAIDGNGGGAIRIDEELSKQILNNIKSGVSSEITTVTIKE